MAMAPAFLSSEILLRMASFDVALCIFGPVILEGLLQTRILTQ